MAHTPQIPLWRRSPVEYLQISLVTCARSCRVYKKKTVRKTVECIYVTDACVKYVREILQRMSLVPSWSRLPAAGLVKSVGELLNDTSLMPLRCRPLVACLTSVAEIVERPSPNSPTTTSCPRRLSNITRKNSRTCFTDLRTTMSLS